MHSQIDKHHIDREMRTSAMRAVDRYLEEHKQFLMQVAVEALLQKLRDKQVTSTEATVPYVKPAPIALADYNAQHPEAAPAPDAAVAATPAATEARSVAAHHAHTEPESRAFHF